MTNAEKRVALAQDVLVQLDAKVFQPYGGAYLMPHHEQCEVCALGAMFVACCGVPTPVPVMGGSPREIVKCLTPLFSIPELAQIEAAFEGGTCLPMYSFYPQKFNGNVDLDRCARVWGRLPDDELDEETEDEEDISVALAARRAEAERRVRAIMQNIIANNGTFVPEAL